jgi:hypothetical protein
MADVLSLAGTFEVAAAGVRAVLERPLQFHLTEMEVS